MLPFADGWDEAKIEAAIARNDPQELLYVPILVSLDPPDCAWSEAICTRLASHTDPWVRGNAILGFGHLARMCGAVDEEKVRPFIETGLADTHAHVRGHANDAAHDLNHFLGWSLPTLD